MNPVFIALLFIGGLLLWLLLAFMYRFVGKVVVRIVSDAIRAMFEENKK